MGVTPKLISINMAAGMIKMAMKPATVLVNEAMPRMLASVSASKSLHTSSRRNGPGDTWEIPDRLKGDTLKIKIEKAQIHSIPKKPITIKNLQKCADDKTTRFFWINENIKTLICK